MAKRFTDTTKWDHDWFTRLTPTQKLLWLYICDRCDGAGIWPVNLALASFQIGAEVADSDLRAIGVGSRMVWIGEDKLLIVGFIAFQYRSLSPKNRAHLGMMRQVVRLLEGIPLDGLALEMVSRFRSLLNDPLLTLERPSIEGQSTLQDMDMDRDKDKNKYLTSYNLRSEAEKSGMTPTPPASQPSVGIPEEVKAEWEQTLRSVNRIPNWIRDETPIARLYQRTRSWDRVKHALAGFRFEKSSNGYEPKAHVHLDRLRDDSSFAYLEALGEQGLSGTRRRVVRAEDAAKEVGV